VTLSGSNSRPRIEEHGYCKKSEDAEIHATIGFGRRQASAMAQSGAMVGKRGKGVGEKETKWHHSVGTQVKLRYFYTGCHSRAGAWGMLAWLPRQMIIHRRQVCEGEKRGIERDNAGGIIAKTGKRRWNTHAASQAMGILPARSSPWARLSDIVMRDFMRARTNTATIHKQEQTRAKRLPDARSLRNRSRRRRVVS
jgi:hypothetical protein